MSNSRVARTHGLTVVASLLLLFSVADLQAVTLWNESISGDLTNNQAAPNAFVLSTGTNSVIGTLRTSSAADNQDWITLNVPVGLQLSSLVLASYVSADATSFTGVQAGTNFVGSTGVAGNYLGYSHFGTNVVGVNLLPNMGNTGIAVGAQGFTPPLGSGDYTFLIQQTGSSATSYEFGYIVTPIPEPSTIVLIGFGLALLVATKLCTRFG